MTYKLEFPKRNRKERGNTEREGLGSQKNLNALKKVVIKHIHQKSRLTGIYDSTKKGKTNDFKKTSIKIRLS